MTTLPKPVLRGHIRRRGVKGIIGAVLFASFNGALYHFLIGVPRARAYENFLKTYDPEAHLQEAKQYFTSLKM